MHRRSVWVTVFHIWPSGLTSRGIVVYHRNMTQCISYALLETVVCYSWTSGFIADWICVTLLEVLRKPAISDRYGHSRRAMQGCTGAGRNRCFGKVVLERHSAIVGSEGLESPSIRHRMKTWFRSWMTDRLKPLEHHMKIRRWCCLEVNISSSRTVLKHRAR